MNGQPNISGGVGPGDVAELDALWFRSKVDWWLGILLVLAPIASVVALISSVVNDPEEALSGVIAVAILVAVYGLLLVPMRYGITKDELIVRFGILRQRIPLNAILEVKPTHNLLSSPALSLDRLAIYTTPGGPRGTMISPTDRESFLMMLAARSGLRRRGDGLTRTSEGAWPQDMA